MRLRAHTPTARCCTRREIGSLDLEDEASRCAMEATDEIKVEGTEMMLTANPDPPEIGGNRGDENRQGKSIAECWFCGKKGHRESEC